MGIEVVLKMSGDKAKALERMLKTLDRNGLMPPYLVMAEVSPKITWCGEGGSGEVDHRHIVTIRVVGEKIYRIEIVEDEV